jgi:nitrous oxide reductase accessory protein NosL
MKRTLELVVLVLAATSAACASTGGENANRPQKILVPTETSEGAAATPETPGGKGKGLMTDKAALTSAQARTPVVHDSAPRPRPPRPGKL